MGGASLGRATMGWRGERMVRPPRRHFSGGSGRRIHQPPDRAFSRWRELAAGDRAWMARGREARPRGLVDGRVTRRPRVAGEGPAATTPILPNAAPSDRLRLLPGGMAERFNAAVLKIASRK